MQGRAALLQSLALHGCSNVMIFTFIWSARAVK